MRARADLDGRLGVLAQDVLQPLGQDAIGIDLPRDRLRLDGDHQADVLAPGHGQRRPLVDPDLAGTHRLHLEPEPVGPAAKRGAVIQHRPARRVVEQSLEVGQRPHGRLQRAQELLGVAREIRQAGDVVGAGHLGAAVVEVRAPLATVVDVPRRLVGRPLEQSLDLTLQEVLQRRPDRAGVEELGLLGLRQPDAGRVVDPQVAPAPVGQDVAEDDRVQRGLDAMRELHAGAGLDVNHAEDRAVGRVLAGDQVGPAFGHLDDRAIQPVMLVEAGRGDQGRLVDRLARLDAGQQPAGLGGARTRSFSGVPGLASAMNTRPLSRPCTTSSSHVYPPSRIAAVTGLWSKGGVGTPSASHSSLGVLEYRR